MENDNVHTLLPNDWKEYLRQDDSPANRARVVTDYISGMTDGYAQKAYARLFLPHHGSLYEVLQGVMTASCEGTYSEGVRASALMVSTLYILHTFH